MVLSSTTSDEGQSVPSSAVSLSASCLSRHCVERSGGTACRHCWLVVGIGGVTCGGKSTLATDLCKQFGHISSHLLALDDFFRPENHPSHVPALGGLNHLNWDTAEALDIEDFGQQLNRLLSSRTCRHCDANAGAQASLSAPSLLIVEGFLVLNESDVRQLCHLMFYIDLSREECAHRRSNRHYEPPDVPGYFDLCVWPMHVQHRDRLMSSGDVARLYLLDGAVTPCQQLQLVTQLVGEQLQLHASAQLS